MRFAFCIEQNVPRLNVTMQNAVLMRVMHSARYLRNEFHCAPDGYWLAPDHFVKLTAFNKLHTEVALAIPFAYFVDRNDARMIQAGGSFGFSAKALQVRLRGPRAKSDDLECNCAIETLLMCAINYSLTAASNFLQQFVLTKVAKD